TNTEEQAFVALIDEKNGIFTQANLALVETLTGQLENIAFASARDLDTLRSIAGKDDHANGIVDRIAQNGIGPDDYDAIRQLITYGSESKNFSPRQLDKLNDVLVKVRPVKRVRSLFTVEDIKVDGDTLEVAPLLDAVPADEQGLAALKADVLANPLLVGAVVSADGVATNLQVELNIAEDDAPNMQAMYGAIEHLLDGVNTDASLHFTGPPMVTAQIADTIQTDNMKFFP